MTQTEWPELQRQLGSALTAMANEMTADRLRPETLPSDSTWGGEIIRLPLQRDLRRRPRLILSIAAAALIAAILAVVGVTLHRRADHAFQPAQDRSQIDWSQVNADWTLVLQSRTMQINGKAVLESLVLVDAGSHSFQVADLGVSNWVLDDWDRRSEFALLSSPYTPGSPTTVLMINLRVGISTRVTVTGDVDLLRFTGISDQSFVMAGVTGMTKFSASGQPLVHFPASRFYSQGVVLARDGQTLITGSSDGLVKLNAATGKVTGTLASPPGQPQCWDPAWQATGDLVASCGHTLYSADTHVDSFSFGNAAGLGAGHTDVQHPLGYLRVFNFAAGTVAMQQSGVSYPLLNRAQFFAIDQDGTRNLLAVPEPIRTADWQFTGVSGDSILLMHTNETDHATLDDLVRWNPLTGAVVQVDRPNTPAGTLLMARGGDQQSH